MFWNKKPKVAEEKSNKDLSGLSLFSTHNDEFSRGAYDRVAKMRASLEKSIQRKASDDETFGEVCAMDAIDGDDVAILGYNGGFNGGANEAQLCFFADNGFIGFQACSILSQNWFINKSLTMPPQDAIRNGYDVTVNDGTDVDPDLLKDVKKLDRRKYVVNDKAVEFVRKGKMFGLSFALFVVESSDPNYYENPFNLDGVTKGSYKGIAIIEPMWAAPILDTKDLNDPTSLNFYEPEFWVFASKKIHKSHMRIFRNGKVSDILKPSYRYGGIPLPQLLSERVYAAERTSNEAPLLTMSKRSIIFKTKLTDAMANGGIFSKIKKMVELNDNYGTRVIGQNDEMQQLETALADVDTVIMSQWSLACSIAEVPSTKMMEKSPSGGLNSSGSYESESYRETLETMQETDLIPFYDRHHDLVVKSDICPKNNIAFFETDTVFKPSNTPTALDQSQINLNKSQTDLNYHNASAIDGVDIRKRLSGDEDGGYNGMPEEVEGMTDNQEDEE